MRFLRKKSRLVWALATIFVAQLFVPLALALAQPERGVVGIIICTSTGLKTLTPDGRLVAAGDAKQKQNGNKTGQTECLVCLTAGLTGTPVLPDADIALVYVPLSGGQKIQVVTYSIPDENFTSAFNARAPPV